MPLYEYQCGACGNRFERIQKFSDPPVEICPNCGERAVEKLLSSPAIQFKGSGWYITDYARKDAGKSAGDSKPADSADSKDGKGSNDAKKPAESSSANKSGSSSTPSTSSDTPKSSS